jgi:hypothetical protein
MFVDAVASPHPSTKLDDTCQNPSQFLIRRPGGHAGSHTPQPTIYYLFTDKHNANNAGSAIILDSPRTTHKDNVASNVLLTEANRKRGKSLDTLDKDSGGLSILPRTTNASSHY